MIKVRNFVLKNYGLKITALIIAITVWAIITGTEESYSEKALQILVEPINYPHNLEVKTVPDAINIKLKGPSKIINEISPERLQVKIDLKEGTEIRKFYFAQDYIQPPQDISILSVHPKLIELSVKELISKSVPVKIQYTGKLPRRVEIVQVKIEPEKVTIVAYKSQIDKITHVYTEPINLSEISETVKKRVGLIQEKEILKFPDPREVEISLLVRKINEDRKPG
jgi:YbbR domain-containing protein